MRAWSAEAVRARLVNMGCCEDDEECLLVARANARLPGSSFRSGCVVLTPRHLLVLRGQKTLISLFVAPALTCELRVELQGITRIVRDNLGTYVCLETIMGSVRLESSAHMLERIVKKLLDARGKKLLQVAARSQIGGAGLAPSEYVVPGECTGAPVLVPAIEDGGACCLASQQGEASPPWRAGVSVPTTRQGRKSIISTGDNFDRLRRSSAIKDVFDTSSHPKLSHAADANGRAGGNGDAPQSPGVGILHRIVAEGPQTQPCDDAHRHKVSGTGMAAQYERASMASELPKRLVLHEHDRDDVAKGAHSVGPSFRSRKSVISTADNFDRCRRSSAAGLGKVRPRSPVLEPDCLSHASGKRPPLARASPLAEAGGCEEAGGTGPTSAEANSAASVMLHLHGKTECQQARHATLMEGWLLKQRRAGVPLLRCWHRRWFQLNTQTLTYAQHSRALGGTGDLVRRIDLTDISNVLYLQGSKPALLLVLQQGKRHIKLRAADAQADDFGRWLQALQLARKVLALQTPCIDVEATPAAFMDIGTDVLLDKVKARIAELLAAQPQAIATYSQSDGVCAWDTELVRLDLVVQSMTKAVDACSRSQSCCQRLSLVPLSHTRSLPLGLRPESKARLAGAVEHCQEQQGCVRLIAVAYTDAIAARLEALLTNGNTCAPNRQRSGLHCVEPQSTSSHSEPLSAGVSPRSRRIYRAGLCSVVMWALRYERTLKLVCGALRQYQTPAHLHGWRHAVCSLGLDACKASRASTGWGLSVPSPQGSANLVVLHCGVLRVYCSLDCTSAAKADSSTGCKRNGASGVGHSGAKGGSNGLTNGDGRGSGEVCSDMEMAVRVSRLQGCEVLRSLSCDQLLWLAAAASTTRFSAGEQVTAAADVRAASQATMAVILDGSVILSPPSDAEHNIAAVVTRLGPSDSFLLASCLLDEPVGVSIRATTSVQVCLVPAEHMRQLLRQDPAFLRETASALHREMETYRVVNRVVTSAPHAARPASGVSALAGPHAQAAEDAISARLAARVGARSASTALHAAAAGGRRAWMSGLKESLFADEFVDVFYSDSRPCLVVVLLGSDGATRLDATSHRNAGTEAGSCTKGDPSQDEKNTFLLRFGDPQTAQAWAEALRKCVWRRGGICSAGVEDLRHRKDAGAVQGERDRNMLNNLVSLIAFGSSPSLTRQSVDLHVSGIFAKHVSQDDREIDLHGLFLGCKECVTALESALRDLNLASSQREVAKEVAEVYLASMFAQARLLLTATSPQHQNRKWTKDLLCLLLTEIPLILDKWALAESVGPLLRTLAHGPVLDRLTSYYMDCMQTSLHKLVTNLCLREERLYRDDLDATDATGEFAGEGKAGGDFGGGIAQESNGRVRSYLVEDLSCVIERELDLCAGVESHEFQNCVHATCLQTCLDVLQKHKIFGRHVSGPDCVGHGAVEESKFCQGGVQRLSDTVSTSSLASSFHSSTSTTAFTSIFTSSAILSPARGSHCSASITLRAACMALNNVSDGCRMCDRLQDRMHDSLQKCLDHSLKSPGPGGAHPERVLSKLHEHFLVTARLAEAAVVDACICRLTAARFFGDVSGCRERISEDEEARYREIKTLLVDVSSYLSEPLCQRDCRQDEEMSDDTDGGLRFARKDCGGDSQGRGPEAGYGGPGPREVRGNVRESDDVDRAQVTDEGVRDPCEERITRKHISYWARRICARVLDFLVMFHVESIRVFLSSSQCPPLQTVINTLERVFKMYLEEFIIFAKLKPLRASLDLLTCSQECIKERVAQHLEDGVHAHVCRNSCVCRDLRPDIASQIDALLRGSEELMSTCDRSSSGAWGGGVEGQSANFVASWSESLARVPLSLSFGSWRWSLLGAQKHAVSPRTLEDTSLLMTGGGAGGGGGGDGAKGPGMHGRHAVQDSPSKIREIEKIESSSTLSSPISLLDYFSPSSKRSLATAREGEIDCTGHEFKTPAKSRWW